MLGLVYCWCEVEVRVGVYWRSHCWIASCMIFMSVLVMLVSRSSGLPSGSGGMLLRISLAVWCWSSRQLWYVVASVVVFM